VTRPKRSRSSHRGHAPGPVARGSAVTAGKNPGGATSFRCGGCGAAAIFAQHERQYGRLVHAFFDRHQACGNAVEISPAPIAAGERVPAGI
jgi:hypothetical protein